MEKRFPRYLLLALAVVLTLLSGLPTADRYRWLGPECWRDFREECEWTLEGDDGDG